MTRDEILNMPASREMDALIAEKVMGWHTYSDKLGNTFWKTEAWSPSTDMRAAWEVVEKLNMAVIPVSNDSDNRSGWVASADELFWVELGWYEREAQEWASADTAPLAICRAALLAVMSE